jgi:replication factor C subunit 3/5
MLAGEKYKSMTLELNASDSRGIGVVRDQIKSFASSGSLWSSGYKLIILDEADSMTSAAQFALRRVIEKYTQNTRFCLICNYVNKIIPALQSRCTRFRFGPLAPAEIDTRMKEIVTKENVNITEAGLKEIIRLSRGDMRKCLNVLQATHLAYPKVSLETVCLCTGNPLPKEITLILHTVLNSSFKESFELVANLQATKGVSLVDIVTFVSERLFKTSLPPAVMMYLIDELSTLEHRLAFGTSERLQLGSFIGCFQIAKQMIVDSSASSSSSSSVSKQSMQV